MAKTQKQSEEEKIVKENVEKRFKNMFTGENEPLSNMSLREVEALKARVAELEALAANPQAAIPDSKPAASTEEATVRSLPLMPAEKIRTDQQGPLAAAALHKLIGLWMAGIGVAVGLASLGVVLYFVFMVQSGMMDMADKVIVPYCVLIIILNVIGLRLVRRNRPLPSIWITYLTNVIAGPVLVVLVVKNLQFLMGGYLVFFSILLITLVLPKTSRWRAGLVAAGATLVITGIEVWNPAFRLSSIQIQNFTVMILGPAALGFFLLFIVTRQLRNTQATRSLTTVLFISFFTLSVVLLLVNGGMTAYTNYTNYQETLAARQSLIAQDASKTVVYFIEEKTRVLETAVGLGSPVVENPETGERVLGSVLGLQPAFRQVVLLNSTGQQLGGISRQSSSLSSQFESQIVEAVRAQTKAGQRYISPIYIDEVTSEPQVVIAVPILSSFGDYQGSLAAELNLKFMWDLVDQLKVGETGYAYVVDYQGNLIAAGDTSRVLRGENVKQIFEVQQFLKDPWYQVTDVTPGLVRYKGLLGENVVGNYVPLVTPTWAVVVELPTREAYQPIIRSLLTSGLIILVFGILAGLAGNFLARRLSEPLTELSKVATEISSGNLGLQAKVSGPTEIAHVASTFNAMTQQLHDLIGSLEQRVADRTHDLELAAEVGRTVTARITQLSEMLSEAAETIRARFDLYYTQIYLTDPSAGKIILRAGTGQVGKELLQRGHNLVINTASLNGRAVVQKQAEIVVDTNENSSFLPNPLLPKTRSEMCVPLIVDQEVVGVLDMQSEKPGGFSESNLPAFEALAGQLAVVIRNATLFMEAEQARSEMEEQVRHSTEEGWQDFLNAIQQGHRVGFAFRDGQITRLQQEALSISSSADGFDMPITLTGTKIGAIRLPTNLKANELELAKSVGEQLAQHIENLRLLAQAELYRAEAEQAVRRLTHEGWDSFLQTHEELMQGYTFDRIEVKPLPKESKPLSDRAIKHAMTIGNEIIGELAVDTPQKSDAEEVVAAIAGQLSAHIESLRLSELNEKHAQREQTLRQITSALRSSTDPTTIVRTAAREVGRILGRKTIVQVVSLEQASQAESARGNANKTDSPADPS